MSNKIGEQIRALRIERDWSQSELAKRANLTVTCISSVERGVKNGSSETLQKISNAFGVALVIPPDATAGGDGEGEGGADE